MFKKFQVKNFRGYDCLQKFFNNEILPDYGKQLYNCGEFHASICFSSQDTHQIITIDISTYL